MFLLSLIGSKKKGVYMKKTLLITTWVLVLLLNNCVSYPNMQGINISSNVSSQILNLSNSGNGNTDKADSIMKNGFLSSGEEYGYYKLDINYKCIHEVQTLFAYLAGFVFGTWFLLGVPSEIADFNLTINLIIMDSNRNIVKSYSDSATIRQYAGLYYGDATKKASKMFTRMIDKIQRMAAAESNAINAALIAAGPIRKSSQYGQVTTIQSVPGRQLQEKIAVFPFEIMDNAITVNESYQLYSIFCNYFTTMGVGKFNIVPRHEVDKLIDMEADFQLTRFSAEEKTADMMQVENATQVISAKIGKVGSRINIIVSLYTYPKLNQLPDGADMRVDSVEELFDKIPELIQKMR
jgi:hypothetical protein